MGWVDGWMNGWMDVWMDGCMLSLYMQHEISSCRGHMHGYEAYSHIATFIVVVVIQLYPVESSIEVVVNLPS